MLMWLRLQAGVALASAAELSFNWLGFLSAMMSNITFGFRAVWSKQCAPRLAWPCIDRPAWGPAFGRASPGQQEVHSSGRLDNVLEPRGSSLCMLRRGAPLPQPAACQEACTVSWQACAWPGVAAGWLLAVQVPLSCCIGGECVRPVQIPWQGPSCLAAALHAGLTSV